MAFPENFRLRSLSVRHGKVESLTPLLAQIKGLEHLTIQDYTSLTYLDQAIIDPTSAIISHKDTLRKLGICLGLSAEVSAPRWDSSFCEENTSLQQTCQSHLPLVDSQSTSYYRKLIASFPSLSILTIFNRLESPSEWSPGRALKIFPASTQLKSVLFHVPGRSISDHPFFGDTLFAKNWSVCVFCRRQVN